MGHYRYPRSQNGRSFHVLRLAFLSSYFNLEFCVKEIRLILRREGTCSIIKQRNLQRLVHKNKTKKEIETTMEQDHKRDRSILVRKYESHPNHKWNIERIVRNHLFDVQSLPSMISRCQKSTTADNTHNPFQYVVFSTSNSPLSGNSALDDPTSTS
jgi:hypothetical protein